MQEMLELKTAFNELPKQVIDFLMRILKWISNLSDAELVLKEYFLG